MPAVTDSESNPRHALRTAALSIAILAVTGIVIWVIQNTEPAAERGGATRRSAALVDTVTVSRGRARPDIVVLGTVEPARDIILSPRVSGEVIALSEAFIPGGFVRQGDLLLRIDPADYQNTLAMRRGELGEAEANLAIEQGRRTVAEKEFALLDERIDPENRSLVLREPQIASARAQVEAAEAMVAQARLDLARTRLMAPFDAQILDRNVNVGSQVAPGDDLGRLVGIDEYWVRVTVPLRSLRWLRFPLADGEGSPVQLRNRGAWAEGVTRAGRVLRLIGTVDEQSRLARVLVSVPDPLARDIDGPPLILGTVVEARIAGRALNDVVALNRDYVRDDDTAWVMVDDMLAIRALDIVFEDARYAYVRDGLETGDQVVTTTLATVAEGIPLRRALDGADATEAQ